MARAHEAGNVVQTVVGESFILDTPEVSEGVVLHGVGLHHVRGGKRGASAVKSVRLEAVPLL